MYRPKDGILEKIQDYLVSLIEKNTEFRGIPIFTHKQSNIESIIANAVREGIGVAILVIPPVPIKIDKNAPGPVFEIIDIQLKVIENIYTNNSGKSSINIAEKITSLLHLAKAEVEHWHGYITCSDTSPWVSEMGDQTNLITLNFTAMCSL
ncbi:MAG: hypothetical protein LBH49_04010 [Puniceicoccales bacterium]|jgi:hypothetical protein|nr:hypothetical protein [Puniceicoccales bacterium]